MEIKKISDVQPGDKVLTSSGNWETVLATSTHQPYGKKITLRLYNDTGPLVFTGNHPVLTPEGFKSAEKLEPGDKVLERIDLTEHEVDYIDMLDYMDRPKSENRSNAGLYLGGIEISDDGERIRYRNPRAHWINRYVPVNSDLMLLLGYYAAEGSCGQHNVQFTFNADEKDYHDNVRELMARLFGVVMSTVSSKAGKSVTLSVSSHPIRSFIKEHVSGTAGHKKLSTLITHAPTPYQAFFIRGYWRGDGSEHAGGYLFTTTSRTLMLQVRTLLLRLGIVSSLSTSRRAGSTGTIRGRVINHNFDLLNLRVAQSESYNSLSEILGLGAVKPPSDVKKNVRARIDNEFLVLTVRQALSGKWSADDTVSNLTVSGDHTYTLPSATTHNCDSLSMACILTNEEQEGGTVETYSNPFFSRSSVFG
jgi:intein/homing endonuclease